MKTLKIPAGAKQITATDTAQTVQELMRTALSDPDYKINPQVDAISLQPEDGTIRVCYDGNSPTSTTGQKIFVNGLFNFENIPMEKFKIIREGTSNVKINIELGITQ